MEGVQYLFLLVIAILVCFHVSNLIHVSDVSLSSYYYLDHTTEKRKSNIYFNGTHYIVNRWYGWQPANMAISNNNGSLNPGKDWVPDVTMLRRMYLDGHDANGNLWPPPLDDGLCEALDTTRPERQLLDEVPIVGAPISKIPETENNKVLCMVYTMENAHATRILAIRETWAPGCDGFLAFSTRTDPRIPAISVSHKGIEEYKNMWEKVRQMFRFVEQHYLSQFDWFYIGGDDLLVFPQNLKNYLRTYNSSQHHYLGRRFYAWRARYAFNTGGSGYAISRPALRCMLKNYKKKGCNYGRRTSKEDLETAKCLKNTCNITVTDTRDDQERERFHHFPPDRLYTYRHDLYREDYWYNKYNPWGLKYGKDCCAPDTVNFHYIKNPRMMRYLFHYVQNCTQTRSLLIHPPSASASLGSDGNTSVSRKS